MKTIMNLFKAAYDWTQTPIGDSLVGGVLFLMALGVIYWLGWLLS